MFCFVQKHHSIGCNALLMKVCIDDLMVSLATDWLIPTPGPNPFHQQKRSSSVLLTFCCCTVSILREMSSIISWQYGWEWTFLILKVRSLFLEKDSSNSWKVEEWGFHSMSEVSVMRFNSSSSLWVGVRIGKYEIISLRLRGIFIFSPWMMMECVDFPFDKHLGTSSTVIPCALSWLGFKRKLSSWSLKYSTWFMIKIYVSPVLGLDCQKLEQH